MTVTLREITDSNREAVLALRVADGQERFVATVRASLADAAEYPQAQPWYRAVYADDVPVGFVMVSWNVEPRPPDIIGPWFLWRMFIDERYQGRGFGAEAVRQVAARVQAAGATELLTSYVPDEPAQDQPAQDQPTPEHIIGPAGFYRRLGFIPTGEHDASGEVIVRLTLR